jgi:NAD+ synthase (glutamine-hydrolysing)
MDFASAYAHGFVRCAAAAPPIRLADPVANVDTMVATVQQLAAEAVGLVVFPELSVTGYANDDLFLQDTLLAAARRETTRLVAASRDLAPVIVVGLPLAFGHRVLNCAAVIHRGQLLGLVPKSYLPTYREFYERRWFGSGDEVSGVVDWDGQAVPIGPDLLFQASDQPRFCFHVEVCEDMWVPVPPSAQAALAGATVLVNLSSSPITIGRADDRELLVRSASLRCLAAYLYTAAGAGESSTDLSWDGQTLIYELGQKLAAGERFQPAGSVTVADIDVNRIAQERLRMGTFDDNRRTLGLPPGGADRFGPARPVALSNRAGGDGGAAASDRSDQQSATSATGDSRSWSHVEPRWPDHQSHPGHMRHGRPGRPGRPNFRRVDFALCQPAGDVGLRRPNPRYPFVPPDPAQLARDCYEAYHIQVAGLVQRLQSIGQPKVIIGVSGGLDSTQALIVAARAMDQLGRPRSDILAFSLPGFATSHATQSSALALIEAVGATGRTIDIQPAARQMLRDLGHPFADGEPVYDVTFENVQAGLRTDYLFRAANQRGGIVLGTGDLSELALGWCTYGVGDQMSHYAVNTGVPKTLIQHLIRWVMAENLFDAATNAVLERVLGQEISPELVPGQALQSTEAVIGPYNLNDFFLYHLLRHGTRPSTIAFLAWQAWRDPAVGAWPAGWDEDRRVAYDLPTIQRWLANFLRRFFHNQFKRSAIPNGPKVTAGGTLSPRGDWRMPSDATVEAWLAELAGIEAATIESPPGAAG